MRGARNPGKTDEPRCRRNPVWGQGHEWRCWPIPSPFARNQALRKPLSMPPRREISADACGYTPNQAWIQRFNLFDGAYRKFYCGSAKTYIALLPLVVSASGVISVERATGGPPPPAATAMHWRPLTANVIAPPSTWLGKRVCHRLWPLSASIACR